MGSSASKSDHGLLKLKIQRDQMLKYRKKLDFQIDQVVELARKNRTNKKLAISYLAQKKYLLKIVNQVDAQQQLLFEMINEIELKSVQVHVIDALKQGNELLSDMNNQLSNSDQVIEDLKDMQDIEVFDPVDFAEELEELEEMQKSMFPNAPVPEAKLPDVPNRLPVSVRDDPGRTKLES
eukprot:NODE_725_length_4780_cov_0.211066.p2 type:complete len:180 gc:universal NODE_725_length_4780_cov_0.211066:658-119(-)